MNLGWLVVAAVAGALLLPSGSNNAGAALPKKLEQLDGAEEIVELAKRAQLSDDWTTFLLAKSYVETGGTFKPLLARGRKQGTPANVKVNIDNAEQNAAKRAYDRLTEQGRLAVDLWPENSWTFGSGGLFGLIPASTIVGTYEKTPLINDRKVADPWTVFEPDHAVFLAIDYTRRLMKWAGYKSDPTWGNVYKGWKQPSNMGKDNDTTRRSVEAFRSALIAIGANPNLVNKRPSSIPDTLAVIRPMILGVTS